MSIPALNAGINGINQGFNNMSRNASAIAQAGNDKPGGNATELTVNVATSLVNLKMDALQIQASAKVVESVDNMIGSLLDVTA